MVKELPQLLLLLLLLMATITKTNESQQQYDNHRSNSRDQCNNCDNLYITSNRTAIYMLAIDRGSWL